MPLSSNFFDQLFIIINNKLRANFAIETLKSLLVIPAAVLYSHWRSTTVYKN